MIATRAQTRGILKTLSKILSSAYLKYCQFIWWTTVSVSCSYWRQHAYLVRFRGPQKINYYYVENLPWWAMEFGKLAQGIWKICCGKLWSLFITAQCIWYQWRLMQIIKLGTYTCCDSMEHREQSSHVLFAWNPTENWASGNFVAQKHRSKWSATWLWTMNHFC